MKILSRGVLVPFWVAGRAKDGPRKVPGRTPGDSKLICCAKIVARGRILGAILDRKSVKINARINAKTDAETISKDDTKIISK